MSLIIPLTFLLFIISFASCNLEHDGSITVQIFHSFDFSDNAIFKERGNISIPSLRIGQANVQQNSLSLDDKKKLRDLAAQNGFYQIKSVVTANDGSERTFLSTVKACMLVEADLDDRISVSLDYDGRVIGVSLVVASRSTCDGAIVSLEKLKEFTTNVYVRHAEYGPNPHTATYIRKLEKEREAKEKGEVKDNRSFLAKYWMYIVPVVILMAITSATNPEQQQAQ